MKIIIVDDNPLCWQIGPKLYTRRTGAARRGATRDLQRDL